MSLLNNEIPLLRGDNIYRILLDCLKSEVAGMSTMPGYAMSYPEWDNLDPHLKIAFGHLGRILTSKITSGAREQTDALLGLDV